MGRLNYPAAFRGPMFASGRDVADLLWSLRQVVVDKLANQEDIDNAEQCPTLDRPHEYL